MSRVTVSTAVSGLRLTLTLATVGRERVPFQGKSESSLRFGLSHFLVGKPVPTFPENALTCRRCRSGASCPGGRPTRAAREHAREEQMDALFAQRRWPPSGKGDGGLTRRGAIGLIALDRKSTRLNSSHVSESL